MVTFAVTLSDLIEKGGAYAGIAAFFGLAVLAVLFFAQARELKRLREWAGRAPERAQELEQRVVEQAEAVRKVRAEPQAQPSRRPGEPATAAAQQAVAAPAEATPADAAEGTEADAPAEGDGAPPADTAPAQGGTAAEHPVVPSAPAGEAAPEAAPAEPAVTEAAGTEPEAETAAADEPADADAEREAVPAGAAATPAAAAGATAPASVPAGPGATPGPGNGAPPASDIPVLPPRATPAPPPRRTAPVPSPAAALRADTSATRRPPPRRPLPAEPEPDRRRTGLIAGLGLAGVLLIVVAFLSFGGGGGPDPGEGDQTTTTPSASTTAESTDPTRNRRRPAVPGRGDTTVAVLNGTTIAGLASSVNTRLQQAGFKEGPTPTNYTDQARSASVVFYASSIYRTRAKEAADLLDVTDIQAIIDPARQLAPGADVVVVVGADQSP